MQGENRKVILVWCEVFMEEKAAGCGWCLCLMFQTLDVPDSSHPSRVWEAVVHWVVGGSGFLTAFKLVFAHSKPWPSHPASSAGGARTSAAAKKQLNML